MKNKHRSRLLVRLLGVMVFLMVVVLLWLFYQDGRKRPAGMQLADLGSPAIPGELFRIGGRRLEMRATGKDIWSKSDEGSFAYRSVQGDVAIQLRVDQLKGGNRWAKVGLMLRASTDADSAHVFIDVLRQRMGVYIYEVIWRPGPGEISQNHRCDPKVTRPFNPAAWIRIERHGQTVTVITSASVFLPHGKDGLSDAVVRGRGRTLRPGR